MSGTPDSSSPTASGRGRGRGRGYGLDSSPLRKPDSRNSSRPGSTSQSPRGSVAQNTSANTSQHSPKTTVSDSSVSTSRKTTLDAGAPEFVPTPTKSTKSLSALSVHAKEFVPSSQCLPSQLYSEITQVLESTLTTLLNSPSSYEQLIGNITSYLSGNLIDDQSMETACNVIFQWAVTESNFSYICARLCEHISARVKNNHNGRFHQHLLKRCHGEHKKIKELLQSNPKQASSFAVFLAELYIREGFRVSKVLHAVLEIIELMVEHLDDNLARSVGQILKMCGGHLEDGLVQENKKERMSHILSQITAKLSSPSGGSVVHFLRLW